MQPIVTLFFLFSAVLLFLSPASEAQIALEDLIGMEVEVVRPIEKESYKLHIFEPVNARNENGELKNLKAIVIYSHLDSNGRAIYQASGIADVDPTRDVLGSREVWTKDLLEIGAVHIWGQITFPGDNQESTIRVWELPIEKLQSSAGTFRALDGKDQELIIYRLNSMWAEHDSNTQARIVPKSTRIQTSLQQMKSNSYYFKTENNQTVIVRLLDDGSAIVLSNSVSEKYLVRVENEKIILTIQETQQLSDTFHAMRSIEISRENGEETVRYTSNVSSAPLSSRESKRLILRPLLDNTSISIERDGQKQASVKIYYIAGVPVAEIKDYVSGNTKTVLAEIHLENGFVLLNVKDSKAFAQGNRAEVKFPIEKLFLGSNKFDIDVRSFWSVVGWTGADQEGFKAQLTGNSCLSSLE